MICENCPLSPAPDNGEGREEKVMGGVGLSHVDKVADFLFL